MLPTFLIDRFSRLIQTSILQAIKKQLVHRTFKSFRSDNVYNAHRSNRANNDRGVKTLTSDLGNDSFLQRHFYFPNLKPSSCKPLGTSNHFHWCLAWPMDTSFGVLVSTLSFAVRLSDLWVVTVWCYSLQIKINKYEVKKNLKF